MSTPAKIVKIDDRMRADYFYLQSEDQCYYLCEYISGSDYSESKGVNQLIHNLKKKMTTQGTREWAYKEEAIEECAAMLRQCVGRRQIEEWSDENGRVVFVPVPPSSIKTDTEYDDRLWHILRLAFFKVDWQAKIRKIVYQCKSTRSSYLSSRIENRLKPSELEKNYAIDEKCMKPPPDKVIIFDDAIASGAHFKAMQSTLEKQYPGLETYGLFICRCVHPASVKKNS